MRVALCQVDPTIADLDGNRRRIREAAEQAARRGARIAVFPELSVPGYPPRDLLDRPGFVAAQRRAVDALAAELPRDLVALVGAVEPLPGGRPGRGGLANAAFLLREGRVADTVHKRLLPAYDVFDERRYFAPGDEPGVVTVDGTRVGVTVCEDIWNDVDLPIAERHYRVNPIDDVRRAGAEVLVNLSASPFTLVKRVGRDEMLAAVARRHRVPLVFVNQVGANDDHGFDGASAVYGVDGAHLARAEAFREDLVVTDLPTIGAGPGAPGPEAAWPATDEAAVLDALALGVRDYVRKTGFRQVLLGVSGGIDSALVAAVACRALGPDNVLGVAMPSRYSTEGSVADARALTEALGMPLRVAPIEPLFSVALDHLGPLLDDLAPATPGDVTFENVQSRLRCTTLMAVSNRTGALLLSTGNKSELAVGYATLYGDMAGGLAVLSDLPKTMVYRVSREVNRQAGRALIPEAILSKPPSAELRADQKDEDSLPPYEVLDPILEHLVEDQWTVAEVVAAGFDPEVVREIAGMVHRNEYKRRQMPPGLIVTRKAFGPGRRYPIAAAAGRGS